MEVIERHSGNGPSDSGGKRFTRISHKVRNSEQGGGVRVTVGGVLEVPVVGELERETRVVARLNSDDIGHEVRTQK